MNKRKLIFFIVALLLFFAVSAVHVYFANAEAMRDVVLDPSSKIDVHQDFIDYSLANQAVDKELGEPYKVYPIVTSPDSEQVFHSTLIEYPFGSSPRSESRSTSLRGILLYVHGFNDYFFQTELAEKADSAGFAFFAIDLHRCGRSLRPEDARADMRSVKEFYAELDVAVELSKKIAVDDYEEAEHTPFVILGHSQGGLITSSYVNDRQDEQFAALILNSPFLDMNFNWFMRKIALPVISEIGLFMPDFSVGSTGDPNYAYSLLKREKGEWEYNEAWKSDSRPTQYLRWLRAIMRAQARVHSGLHIKSPVLVLHGDCSAEGDEWTDDYMHCDGVLNVEHIAEWAPHLGENVTTKTVPDGLHDLLLSRKEVRDNAYREIFGFMDSVIK